MRSGLYALLDADVLARRGLDLETTARSLIAAEPSALQLRAKSWSDARTLEVLRWLRAIVPRDRTLLFANDRPDLARLAGCDGVHVGQDDVPVPVVREHYPELLVGCSTHDEAQFEIALALEVDYVALGPIFATSSKENPDPVVGIERLGRLAEKARERSIPVVAIGGIDLGRAALLRGVADAIAVIGALLPETNSSDAEAEILRRARALTAAFLSESEPSSRP